MRRLFFALFIVLLFVTYSCSDGFQEAEGELNLPQVGSPEGGGGSGGSECPPTGC